ncbi:MAG: hypothetical protein ABIP75_12740 [Pyrinomonadaceae bacterium]
MKILNTILGLFLCLGATCVFASAQTATTSPTPASQELGITPNLAQGEVTELSPADLKLTLTTKHGAILVTLTPTTVYKRMPLGETDQKKAVPTTLAEIGVGDRLIAVGKVADDKKSVPARLIFVMSKADVAKKQAHDREEWTRRGITGKVTAVDAAANTISVAARTREGEKPITIIESNKATFLRYAPDSVKFSDAKVSSLAEVKVGDQLRALGNKNEDGLRYTPEEIVFGSFSMVAGAITAIDPAKGEITIKNLQTNLPMVIVTNKDSLLRKFPAEMAAMMARPNGTNGGPNSGSSTGPGGAPAGSAPAGQTNGPRRMGGDVDAMLERLPAVTLVELKKGDMIAVSSTKGSDPGRVTAIKLLAGIEAFMTAAAGPQRPGGAGQPPSMNLPGLDSIGLP